MLVGSIISLGTSVLSIQVFTSIIISLKELLAEQESAMRSWVGIVLFITEING